MSNFGYLIQKFFQDYLENECGYSSNTLYKYKYTFKLLLQYFDKKLKVKPSNITFEDLNVNNILNFLNYLETDRNNSIKTRNDRLSNIKTFFKFIQGEEPQLINLSQHIMSIKTKSSPNNRVSYFTIDEWKIFCEYVLNKIGYKEFLMMVLLYETGIRISSLIGIKLDDLNLNDHASIKINGKGSKVLVVPISDNVVKLIYKYKENYYTDYGEHYLFYSSHKKQYNRTTFNKMFYKVINILRNKYPSQFLERTYSPHMVRHSKAEHLLEKGVPLIVIKELLGHSSISATEVYITPNLETIRKQIINNSDEINAKDKYSHHKKESLDEWLNNYKKY